MDFECNFPLFSHGCVVIVLFGGNRVFYRHTKLAILTSKAFPGNDKKFQKQKKLRPVRFDSTISKVVKVNTLPTLIMKFIRM